MKHRSAVSCRKLRERFNLNHLAMNRVFQFYLSMIFVLTGLLLLTLLNDHAQVKINIVI